VRLEGLGKLKNPMTSSGFETATFRLVLLLFTATGFAPGGSSPSTDEDDEATLYSNNNTIQYNVSTVQ
jgi:hypothetical protein